MIVRRWGGERGQVAGIEALPFGLLVFIGGVLLLVNIWAVVDAKFAADAAAREASRFVVESAAIGRDPGGLRRDAGRIAAQVMRDHDHDRPVTVLVHTLGSQFERCDRVEVSVRTDVPAIRIPFVGGYGDGFAIEAVHSELVDPTRSGVDGEATCIR